MSTSAEEPAAVRTIARHLMAYVDKLGSVWIEGQVAQLNRRPGSPRVFFTLRDTAAEMSLSMSCPADVAGAAMAAGDRIVVHAKAEFYGARGVLSFGVREIRQVGIGALLAQLEQLRTTLAAEGLFAASRKRALPFLPSTIGLICGRASDAERDVVENAKRRWPAVRFEIREVAVQGNRAVSEVIAALGELDAHADVDVIVIARGGGSVEDLLPFSNEALLRAVAAAQHPVFSAIGHEKDSPLLDLVADVRVSTPTDAARALVPDLSEQTRLIDALRTRARRAAARTLESQRDILFRLTRNPVLADRHGFVETRRVHVTEFRNRSRRSFANRLEQARLDVAHVNARARGLSPLATLERGYAIVQLRDGAVVDTPIAAPTGTDLRIRVAGGAIAATVIDSADDAVPSTP